MPNTPLMPQNVDEKPLTSVQDKIFSGLPMALPTDSLQEWANYYYQVHVKGAPEKTEQAKQKDLAKFLAFFQLEVGHDHIDSWTPAVTKHFQKALKKTLSPVTQKPYKATSINRIMATLRHFGRWLHKQRPFLAGDPLANVKDIRTDAPDWNGLTPRQLMRLKSACEQRMKSATRKDQNPLLETAVFYTLLGSGLRESELVSLDVYQYQAKGLQHVVRHKSKRIPQKVPLPQEAREFLDLYLASRNSQPDEPLFMTRYGTRLRAIDVYRICQRVLKQALAYLPDGEKFHLSPHKLRHTFLKKLADKHGIQFAHEVSGNVSVKEIFRYAKPSQAEIQDTIEQLFN